MQYREVFPYIASTVKRLVKSPKGYLINNGLVSYLTGIQDFALLNSTGLLGHRFENWILNELLTWTDSNLQSHGINYWRTSGGTEVDFILTVGDQVLPIEVTFSSQILPKKIRHLKEFMQKESKAKWGICLYNGSFQIQKEEKIICIPAWMV
jgi:predicted AAA+ superfamily ATPase